MGLFPLIVTLVWEMQSDRYDHVYYAGLGPGKGQGQEGCQAFRGLMGVTRRQFKGKLFRQPWPRGKNKEK